MALYHAITYIANNSVVNQSFVWKSLGLYKVFVVLRNNQKEALLFNAAMEVGLFFACVLRLFTKMRSFMLCFMVLNTLKMRYKSPESSYVR